MSLHFKYGAPPINHNPFETILAVFGSWVSSGLAMRILQTGRKVPDKNVRQNPFAPCLAESEPRELQSESATRVRDRARLTYIPKMPPAEFPTTPRVLVVEDEQKTRDSLAEGLRMESWAVHTAGTGNEALDLLNREAFDLIVLDWMLPDRDGIEVLQRVRGQGQHTPVLMLTARSTLNDRVIGLDSGADDYVSKPFAFAELLARCRALLRRPMWTTGRL